MEVSIRTGPPPSGRLYRAGSSQDPPTLACFKYLFVHPWQSLVYLALVFLLLLYIVGQPHLTPVSSTWEWRSQAPGCPAFPSEGPLSIFEDADVTPGPQPTMSDTDLGTEGKVVRHADARGSIHRYGVGDGVVVNIMRTHAGALRSGDIHNCTQYDVLQQGRVRLRMTSVATKEEVVKEFGANEFICIPPRVAHLFEFLEESVMLEWWSCEFQAWFYKPYRDLLQQALDKQA